MCMCVCVCLCMIQGQIHRRRDQHRVLTESYSDKFAAHHRYDSDSSLDLAAHADSVMLPHKTFRHSLSRLRSSGRHSAGSQSHENVHILSQGHSRLDDSYLRSNDTQDEEDKVNEKEKVVFREDHSRSQDMKTNKEWLAEDRLFSAEGHSRSDDLLCTNCGCERSTVITTTTVDHNRAATSRIDVIVAEPGQSQGSVAARKSRSDSQTNTQGSAAVGVGQNEASQGRVGPLESRCSGIFAVESYSGDISRELCQQLIELLSDLNMARDLNIDVCFASSLIY